MGCDSDVLIISSAFEVLWQKWIQLWRVGIGQFMVMCGGRNTRVEGGSDDFSSSMTCRTCVVIRHYWRLAGWKLTQANCEEREKTNKMQQSDVYYQHCLNMFRASLCPSSGEQRLCMWCAALVLLDVVGSGCGALCCRVRALWRLLFNSKANPGPQVG